MKIKQQMAPKYSTRAYNLSMKTALANDLSRFKEVIVRLERSDMAYTADKVVELFSSPADCGGFVSFTW